MRTFSPDFSHSLEFALPLVSQQSAHSMAVSLAQRLAEGTAVVEVWHKVPTSDSWGAGSVGGAVCGRRLGPAIRDVCLGQAVLPLIQLLQKQSGVLIRASVICLNKFCNCIHACMHPVKLICKDHSRGSALIMFYPCKISHCDVSELCTCDLPEYNTHVLHMFLFRSVWMATTVSTSQKLQHCCP